MIKYLQNSLPDLSSFSLTFDQRITFRRPLMPANPLLSEQLVSSQVALEILITQRASFKIKVLQSSEITKLASNLHLQRGEYLTSCKHVKQLITINTNLNAYSKNQSAPLRGPLCHYYKMISQLKNPALGPAVVANYQLLFD